ncbi:hypothetical protein LY474_32085 [Myxococcus stipitatus]|uniref:hypothetical protein n=1 Tax=Myxococcus stipitatus TaxID=83455 RepID=UPI001F205387|nr:hypothetical protein [Myxococcus stipitatus]MCE9672457.1 hypothetical protein [Myxococcus stipitatus]
MVRRTRWQGCWVGLVAVGLLACGRSGAEGREATASDPATRAAAQAPKTAAPAQAQARPAEPPPKPETDAKAGGGTSADGDAKPAEEDAAPTGGDGKQCTGTPTFCAVYSEMFCTSQPGCLYSYAARRCMGVAVKCSTATTQPLCAKIKGCKWK